MVIWFYLIQRIMQGPGEVAVTFEDIVDNDLPTVVRVPFSEIAAIVPTHAGTIGSLY